MIISQDEKLGNSGLEYFLQNCSQKLYEKLLETALDKLGYNNLNEYMLDRDDNLIITTTLKGFKNTDINVLNPGISVDNNGNRIKYIQGTITDKYNKCICPKCGKKMHINNTCITELKHLPLGDLNIKLVISRKQYFCDKCHITMIPEIPFKAKNHSITTQLERYIKDLLETSYYTLKEISCLTGVDRNIIKEIDKKRLQKKYTVDGKGKQLKKPQKYSEYLGIDEFKLHNSRKYATHIMDLKTGRVLWVAEGRKKEVVYNFMKLVGHKWMKHVKAVACDMNSDFYEAFKDKYPHIKIVFDHFHIIKHFNEEVVDRIRKDEQLRLRLEGKKDDANALQSAKYILYGDRSSNASKDDKAKEKKVVRKGSILFNTKDKIRKDNNLEEYISIVENNKLLLTVDMVKEALRKAYQCTSKLEMARYIKTIYTLCDGSQNKWLIRFKEFMKRHYDGIISHATFPISSAMLEGTNNKIKTIRRQSYGLPDDEYFFLKIIDVSYHE